MEAAHKLEQFEDFSNQVPYGITINKLDGSYVRVNPTFCDICGYSEHELLSMGFQDLTHPEDIAPNVELDRKLKLKLGEIPYFQMAKRYVTKAGTQKHVLLQVSLIRDTDEQPTYYYAQVIDVTDLGHLLDSNKVDNDYLDLVFDIPIEQRHSNIGYEILRLYRQQNLRKVKHLGHVAHELKNPLNGVIGMASMAARCIQRGDTEKALACLTKVTEGGYFMERLVNELLDMTYIETGSFQPKLSEFSIVNLIHSATQSLISLSSEHGIPVEIDSEVSEELHIHSDRDRLFEVMTNLISNAIKYTEHGQVKVSIKRLDSEINIAVIDSGIGIANHNLEAIFDEFKKVHGQLQKNVNSTGLGLPIARKLIRMLGGDIYVASELGKGSTFTVTLDVSLQGNTHE